MSRSIESLRGIRSLRVLCLAALVGVATLAPPAQADVIELADGRILHGKIIDGETNEDGLAVQVFSTGGTITISWDHVLESRRKQLRIDYGIDIPEEEQVTVPGHMVTLVTGKKVRGVAKGGADARPLVLKTRTGEQSYDGSQVAAVVEIGLPILEAYTIPEAYALQAAKQPVDSASAHFAMADFSMRIGDFAHAVEHLNSAAADGDFAATTDGKTIATRLRRASILLEAEGARKLAEKIKFAMYKKDWNDALSKLKDLDGDYPDEQIRGAIGFDRLRSRVEKGREKHFKARVQTAVYRKMIDLMRDKARQKKALRSDDDRPGAAVAGTLAGAKQWLNRELPTLLWEGVASDLGLEQEEMDRFWSQRSSKRPRIGLYGTGSFIVVKTAARSGGAKRPRRRPPGPRAGNRGPGSQKEAKPMTDEGWWAGRKTGDRVKWLEAYFAKNSGLFEVLSVDDTKLCDNCAGEGILTAGSVDGGQNSSYCPKCNGAGKFRRVSYR